MSPLERNTLEWVKRFRRIVYRCTAEQHRLRQYTLQRAAKWLAEQLRDPAQDGDLLVKFARWLHRAAQQPPDNLPTSGDV